MGDRKWRYENLYWIKDDHGREVKFVPNETQWRLDDNLWTRNIVAKSRQHGITTWACIRGLDTALFRKNTNVGVIAHTKEDAGKFFRDKILYAYERLPEWLKGEVYITRKDLSGTVEFSNGSKIEVSVSHRGGTFQFLHISEYGPMCADAPQRAEEVKTGALNTVQPDCIVVIESTAKGEYNDYAMKAKKAKTLDDQIKAGTAQLSVLDYRLHFFPWWEDPRNQISPEHVLVTEADEAYFVKAEAETGHEFTPEQKAWYVKKREEQGDKMLREHPTTFEEMFQGSTEGSYYGSLLAKADLEGRIGEWPFMQNIPVNTFWDIGHSDATGIWFHQQVGIWHHFIDYYENEGEAASHYAKVLQDKAMKHGYVYGKHYLPHDAGNQDWSHPEHKTRKQALELLMVKPIIVVPRIKDITEGIEMVRVQLPMCRFNKATTNGQRPDAPEKIIGGLPALRSYRKRFNELTQKYSDEPVHDWASTSADAFRQFGQGYRTNIIRDKPADTDRRRQPPSWRSV